MNRILLILLVCATFLWSCGEDEKLGQFALDSLAPGAVSNVRVENGYGAAKLTYTLPNDKDLLYVKASYQINDKVSRETQASGYVNDLLVDGFGKSQAYTVTLVAVDKSKNVSEPVEVTVNPMITPVDSIFKTLKMTRDFGGISLEWKNPFGKEINIEVLVNDTINAGEKQWAETIYSSAKQRAVAVRGFRTNKAETEETQRTFTVSITDRWGNKSSILENDIIPIYEQKLDGNKLFDFVGPLSTAGEGSWGTNWSALFDGKVNHNNTSYASSVDGGVSAGAYLTFDLGQPTLLSRVVLYRQPAGGASGRDWAFNNSMFKRYRFWATNDYDAAVKDKYDLSAWTPLGEYEFVKPSGNPLGNVTDEDLEFANRGSEAALSLYTNGQTFRYLRYELVENYVWTGGMAMSELEVYGSRPE